MFSKGKNLYFENDIKIKTDILLPLEGTEEASHFVDPFLTSRLAKEVAGQCVSIQSDDKSLIQARVG